MRKTCIIAVHAGAGYHAMDKEHEYKAVCISACNKAMSGLNNGMSALEAVAVAVKYLEDASCTNAGMGSSLNMEGTVECDASIMDGLSLNFGSVGAISGINNPILVAKKLVDEQKQGVMSLGRIPPCTMVGTGATKWACEHGIPVVAPDSLISDGSMKQYKNNKRRLETAEEKRQKKRRKYLNKNNHHTPSDQTEESKETVCNGIQDTVGAVCIDKAGNMAAGVSSGGISLKQSGRLGSAAMHGSGCWAMNWKSDTKPGVAVATSGTGEHLMKTLLARECAQRLQQDEFTENAFRSALQEKFLDSDLLAGYEDRYGALLALKFDKSATDRGQCDLLWGHTTDSMCIGYLSSDSKVKTVISRLDEDKVAGHTFVMEGKSFHL